MINIPIKVIIQSRLSSKRLPGKALLPVGGYPAIVLCAKRAANNGHDVVVATSMDHSDDFLCEILKIHGIDYFRGSLNDVFERFFLATKTLAENAVIVRLTADNLFPDGEFIQKLLDQMLGSGRDYLKTFSPVDGLPYGMSAEVFSVKTLRHCVQGVLTDFDREHVTPAIQREYGKAVFSLPDLPKWTHLRCTMDYFADYQRLFSVFKDVDDPIQVSWVRLCEILSAKQPHGFRIPFQEKRNEKLVGCMTLGSAQLGIDGYGIVNDASGLSQEDVTEIIQSAMNHGVTSVDVARAYGNAEHRVGCAMKTIQRDDACVITKLDPLVQLTALSDERFVCDVVDASVYRSCYELGVKTLPVLMLHRWEHRFDFNGVIWNRLRVLQEKGVIGALGASVSTPIEMLEALDNSEIKHLQIPFNLLDKRWQKAAISQRMAERPDVVVYARSIFLQGILLHTADRWPQIASVNVGLVCTLLDRLMRELNRQTRADLCVAYVRGQKWIDSLVVGVDSCGQLKENLQLMMLSPLTREECLRVEEIIPALPEELLNPSQWNKCV